MLLKESKQNPNSLLSTHEPPVVGDVEQEEGYQNLDENTHVGIISVVDLLYQCIRLREEHQSHQSGRNEGLLEVVSYSRLRSPFSEEMSSDASVFRSNWLVSIDRKVLNTCRGRSAHSHVFVQKRLF